MCVCLILRSTKFDCCLSSIVYSGTAVLSPRWPPRTKSWRRHCYRAPPTIPPSYIRVRVIVYECGARQSDIQTYTDTQTAVITIHFAWLCLCEMQWPRCKMTVTVCTNLIVQYSPALLLHPVIEKTRGTTLAVTDSSFYSLCFHLCYIFSPDFLFLFSASNCQINYLQNWELKYSDLTRLYQLSFSIILFCSEFWLRTLLLCWRC